MDDGNLMVGITEHAQDLLGDMVFVEVPEPGGKFEPGQSVAVVESVKAASDVYCPVAGEIIEDCTGALDDRFTVDNPVFLPYGFRQVNIFELPANTVEEVAAKQS